MQQYINIHRKPQRKSFVSKRSREDTGIGEIGCAAARSSVFSSSNADLSENTCVRSQALIVRMKLAVVPDDGTYLQP